MRERTVGLTGDAEPARIECFLAQAVSFLRFVGAIEPGEEIDDIDVARRHGAGDSGDLVGAPQRQRIAVELFQRVVAIGDQALERAVEARIGGRVLGIEPAQRVERNGVVRRSEQAPARQRLRGFFLEFGDIFVGDLHRRYAPRRHGRNRLVGADGDDGRVRRGGIALRRGRIA